MPLVKKNGILVSERGDSKFEFSKSSVAFFRRLLDYLTDPEKAIFATHGGEFSLEGKAFDFAYPPTRALLEWSGNFYHGDPRIYPANYKIFSRTAEEVWKLDFEKEEIARRNGYKLLVIWEDSYNKEKKIITERVINFLLEDLSKNPGA